MEKSFLKEIIQEQMLQAQERAEHIMQRQLFPSIAQANALPHAVIITGLRRVGKSSLLTQYMALNYPQYYFLNFEDERLIDFQVSDFNNLYEAFLELQGKLKVWYLDEIQNIIGWEAFARRMQDSSHKLFITGSNASLLSKELGTKLTGRHVSFALYPYSFQEYINFKNITVSDSVLTTTTRAELKQHFNNYLKFGGMPEYVKYEDINTLKHIYDDILYRDIIVRYEIKAVAALRHLALWLLTNVGNSISLSKLQHQLQLGSINTLKNFLFYLENSYLISTVHCYHDSLLKQMNTPKKIYIVDNGFVEAIAFQFSQNSGKYLENLVFVELKRRGHNIYYYKTRNNLEVDFLIREGRTIKALIQVSYSMHNASTKERELQALITACKELNLECAYILTHDHSETIEVDNIKIYIQPTYLWLLGLAYNFNLLLGEEA